LSCLKSSFASKGEGVNKRTVGLKAKSKTAAIYTAHSAGAAHWATLCSVKLTLARHIEVAQHTGLVA